jgi:hypothetical protein
MRVQLREGDPQGLLGLWHWRKLGRLAPRCNTAARGWGGCTRNKSLFASFSLEKEESSFFEKKEAKKLLISDVRVRRSWSCGQSIAQPRGGASGAQREPETANFPVA